MLRSAHFSLRQSAALLAAALLPLAASGQQDLKREGNAWTRTITMVLAAQPRLVIEAHGPVTLESGVSNDIQCTVKFSVAVQDEAEARRILGLLGMRVRQGQGTVTLLPPGGPALTTVWVKAPRLDAAAILTSGGGVDVRGIDGTLSVDAVGDLQVDRVGGDCRLFTGGGDVRAGHMGGSVRCTTRAGRIEVKSARGESILTTDGGDIVGWQMGGPVTAHTGGGNVLIVAASGTVDASTGGGEIQVVRAGGAVTARNMLGPVTIGGASGVQCENATGGVRVGNILGPMRISTAMGSIVASLFGSRIADSLLATANGDITVAVPSNVGVTIRADNELSDTMRRITSEFPNIRVRRQGTHLVAEGPLNGGGPVLQIAAAGGTIYIRRQR
jgi:DUF4097 and DUF4098 domain-containing protein YvlB